MEIEDLLGILVILMKVLLQVLFKWTFGLFNIRNLSAKFLWKDPGHLGCGWFASWEQDLVPAGVVDTRILHCLVDFLWEFVNYPFEISKDVSCEFADVFTWNIRKFWVCFLREWETIILWYSSVLIHNVLQKHRCIKANTFEIIRVFCQLCWDDFIKSSEQFITLSPNFWLFYSNLLAVIAGVLHSNPDCSLDFSCCYCLGVKLSIFESILDRWNQENIWAPWKVLGQGSQLFFLTVVECPVFEL